jgi:hypothetical protein
MGLLSRRHFCLCCMTGAAFAGTRGWLSPRQASAEADRRYGPVAERGAVEQNLEARIGRKRRRCQDQIAGAARERNTGEHRVRRADAREQRRARDVQVLGMVEAPVRVRDAPRRVGIHPQRPRLVMRGAQLVASGARNRLTGGERGGDLHHDVVHGGPQIPVPRGGLERHRGAPHPVFIGARIEVNPAVVRGKVVRIRRLHFSEATNGDRHVRIGRGAQLIVEIDVRDLAVMA